MKAKTLLLYCLIFCAITSCKTQPDLTAVKWNIAPNLNDGWETTNPASVGINEDSLIVLFDLIRNNTPPDFRALIVVKDGKLAVEQYFNSFWRTNIHDIRSAGKSITSMLAGIAMDKGLFKPSDKVIDFFNEYEDIANMLPVGQGGRLKKSEITVADLLVMSSGLAADAYVDDSPGREGLMIQENDYTKFVLDLPMDFEPGSRYAYNSAAAYLLGVIVEKTSGQTLQGFAKANLFNALQIESFFWQKCPEGHNTGMGNLYFIARDFAKLGQVMLDKGKWKGQAYLSEQYVADSFRKKFDISDSDPFAQGYGYMWYLAKLVLSDAEGAEVKGRTFDFYFASGNGGNKIFIIPELNMVVTTMSSAYGQGRGQFRSHKILEKVLEAAF